MLNFNMTITLNENLKQFFNFEKAENAYKKGSHEAGTHKRELCPSSIFQFSGQSHLQAHRLELHLFGDASAAACGAVAYLRRVGLESNGSTFVHISRKH